MIDSNNRPAGDADAPPPEDEHIDEAAPQGEASEETLEAADADDEGVVDDDSAEEVEDEERIPAEQVPARTGRRKGLDLSKASIVDPAAADADNDTDGDDDQDDNGNGTEKEPAEEIDYGQLGRTVEALLFASESPLSARELARAASSRAAIIRKVIKHIIARYEESPQPWDLAEVGGGYRLVTRPEYFPALQRLKTIKPQRKLTPAALETLAYIAYSKEPVGRADLENVRGVDSGAVLRQLLERKLIKIAGRGEGLGQPLLYGVSGEFLEYFGLKSVEDLPRASEFRSA